MNLSKYPVSLACTFLIVIQLVAGQAASPQSPVAQSSQPGVPAISSYPDSPRGLEKLVKDMLKMEKTGKSKELAPYVQSLVLPNYDAWFRATFGDEIGATLSGAYERKSVELPMSFPDTLADLIAKHRTDPEAVRFTDSCNPQATEYEYPVLILRQGAEPLYDIRFISGGTMMTISYFAYADGAFRYLGNFQVTGGWPIRSSNPRSAPSPDEKKVRVGADVQAARLVYRVNPIYPVDAESDGIQGTVLLHAIIGKDGAIHGLQLIKGQCWLAKSAIAAVGQWRYSPTFLSGQPVQVDTTITVIYNLGPPR